MSFPRRIVGDYDVDRVQVEAWQHVEPSTTNHPFGLIPVFGIGIAMDRQGGSVETSGSNQIRRLHADVSERIPAKGLLRQTDRKTDDEKQGSM